MEIICILVLEKPLFIKVAEINAYKTRFVEAFSFFFPVTSAMIWFLFGSGCFCRKKFVCLGSNVFYGYFFSVSRHCAAMREMKLKFASSSFSYCYWNQMNSELVLMLSYERYVFLYTFYGTWNCLLHFKQCLTTRHSPVI